MLVWNSEPALAISYFSILCRLSASTNRSSDGDVSFSGNEQFLVLSFNVAHFSMNLPKSILIENRVEMSVYLIFTTSIPLYHHSLHCQSPVTVATISSIQKKKHRPRLHCSTHLSRNYFVAFIENHSNTKIVIVIIFSCSFAVMNERSSNWVGGLCMLWFNVTLRSVQIIHVFNIDNLIANEQMVKQFDKFLQLFSTLTCNFRWSFSSQMPDIPV